MFDNWALGIGITLMILNALCAIASTINGNYGTAAINVFMVVMITITLYCR